MKSGSVTSKKKILLGNMQIVLLGNITRKDANSIVNNILSFDKPIRKKTIFHRNFDRIEK